MQNKISEEFPQQRIDEILGHINAIHTALPFLVALGPQDRQRMIKAGSASQPFIRKSLDVAPHVMDYLPRGLDVAEMHKDVATMDGLHTIMVALGRLAEHLRDTHALVTSEAYSAALQIYRGAKDAQGEQGLEDIVRDLGRRFTRSGTPTEPEAPSAAAPEGPLSPPAA